ncbi:MAG: hypothetical protein FE78DRAFT_508232 [Acidomyces sp. 'richmondensis']|nr:MAG: hypothetical protein FE78DRAFT_508232 [Acidomyces sp. 'richmondensis']
MHHFPAYTSHLSSDKQENQPSGSVWHHRRVLQGPEKPEEEARAGRGLPHLPRASQLRTFHHRRALVVRLRDRSSHPVHCTCALLLFDSTRSLNVLDSVMVRPAHVCRGRGRRRAVQARPPLRLHVVQLRCRAASIGMDPPSMYLFWLTVAWGAVVDIVTSRSMAETPS